MPELLILAGAVLTIWWLIHDIDAYMWNKKVDAWADAMHQRGAERAAERDWELAELRRDHPEWFKRDKP